MKLISASLMALAVLVALFPTSPVLALPYYGVGYGGYGNYGGYGGYGGYGHVVHHHHHHYDGYGHHYG